MASYKERLESDRRSVPGSSRHPPGSHEYVYTARARERKGLAGRWHWWRLGQEAAGLSGGRFGLAPDAKAGDSLQLRAYGTVESDGRNAGIVEVLWAGSGA